jgi:glycosyltransferase involved in cell wall biosynthesis
MNRVNKKACFYASGIKLNNSIEQYYIQDINILKSLGYTVTVASSFKEIPFDCDLYFSWWASGSIFPLIIAKLVNKPIITIAGGNECQLVVSKINGKVYGYLSYGIVKRFLVRVVLKFSDKLVAVSNYMVKDIIKINQSSKKNISVIYNSIDTKKFVPDFGIERKYIATIASTNSPAFDVKNLHNFLLACNKVLEVDPSQEFIVIGRKGDAHSKFLKIVDELELSDNIKFINDLPNEKLASVLVQCFLYVQISEVETFGVSVCEALSCGTPVLVSTNGALPEVVGEYGDYCIFDNVDDISSCMIDAFDQKQSNITCEQNKRHQYIHSKFSYEVRLEQFKSLIYELVGKK